MITIGYQHGFGFQILICGFGSLMPMLDFLPTWLLSKLKTLSVFDTATATASLSLSLSPRSSSVVRHILSLSLSLSRSVVCLRFLCSLSPDLLLCSLSPDLLLCSLSPDPLIHSSRCMHPRFSMAKKRRSRVQVILLQVLIEQEPLTGTLASDVGPLLRKVLYDAMLVDYTFLDLECEDHPSFSHLKSIALMRLIVASEAVELFSQAGEQKWFEELEQQGVKIFAEGTAKYSDKGEDNNANDNDAMLCIDKVGEKETENKEEVDKVSNAFVASAHKMSTTVKNKARKMEAGSSGNVEKKQKKTSVTDNDFSDSSGGESLDVSSDGDDEVSSGGESNS